MDILHPKGGGIVWTFVKYIIIKEKKGYKYIGLRGFDHKIFAEEDGVGVRLGLYGYPYLKHLIKLWQGYWENHISKMNAAVGDKNIIDNSERRKWLVCHFTKEKF